MQNKYVADRDVKQISGENLRIGGEGMKGFYDQILPRFMDKYGKKWGVKTGEVELPNLERDGRNMWAVDVTPEMKESVMEGQAMFSLIKTDWQGNPIDKNGSLLTEKISSIEELTDDDFLSPSRSVELPALPKIVDEAIGAHKKPVIIKKNIFIRNKNRHSDLTPEQSREILKTSLYQTKLYGQNKKTSKPYNWVVISIPVKEGNNRLVLLEVDEYKDHVEIIHWHYIDDYGLRKIKNQAEREGGQILILPSEEEAGALSSRTSDLISGGKDIESTLNPQENLEENEDFDEDEDPVGENTSRFSTGRSTTATANATARQWDKIVQSLSFGLAEVTADYLHAVDRFQKFLADKTGKAVLYTQDVYNAMLQLSSRNFFETKKFDEMLVTPLNLAILDLLGNKVLVKSWRKRKDTGKLDFEKNPELQALDRYVKMKHGVERNRDMSVRSVLIPRGQQAYQDALDAVLKPYRDDLERIEQELEIGRVQENDKYI